MLEMEILKSVVEQQCVDLPFIDGEPTAFHPVLVHDYNHVLQVVGEHIRLIAGGQ